MNVSLWDWFFADRCYVLDFDGEIARERTKFIGGVRFVSRFGWCGNWHATNGDKIIGKSFMYKWAFTTKDLVKDLIK
jgi:hypothetical protein